MNVNLRGLESTVDSLSALKVTSEENRIAWALKAMTLTDLTTLAGDDCFSNVERLCIRACYPFSKDSLGAKSEFSKQLHVAAVCVYPTKVKDAYDTLTRLKMVDRIQIAAGETTYAILIASLVLICRISLSGNRFPDWTLPPRDETEGNHFCDRQWSH